MSQAVLFSFRQEESDISTLSNVFSFYLGYNEELQTAKISISTVQKRRSINREVKQYWDIPVQNIFDIGIGSTLTPIRPRRTPQPDATEKLAGSLMQVFPELNKVSDEIIDRAIRRLRKKG